tara:strand:- start:822 stop:1244 length:423 start_codon:yes stop_codon:yes gene_type:complete
MSEKKCIDLINSEFADREADFSNAYRYFIERENCTEGELIGLNCFYRDLEHYEDFFHYINEYGLSWDYVEAEDETECGYYRFQLSWGGPSDEFRIYIDDNYDITVFYHYADWFDGAIIEVPSNTKSFEVCRQLLEVEEII